ncbi:hypothetical protein C5167_028001 [Papaver somniferum]|uniref:uncharacterized protein LOC113341003 isoform X1 n=1 Tax=Papaver somniferum TaxID=3469 RepID=UPI000E6F6EDA|nr:uncharacterized protein LOC113341003 isoform X1 [Papaver somniferum]RZC92115.1 hypothetical protein C5167_028001 [Papaver somniferum]
MANTLCYSPVNAIKAQNRPGFLINNPNAPKVIRVNSDIFRSSQTARPHLIVVKADAKADANPSPPAVKVSSIVCKNCEGNGAVACSQCEGNGVNSVDHFDGRFKAGGLCWLCRGKKEMLCGDCNGAGFTGGFMSTFDE